MKKKKPLDEITLRGLKVGEGRPCMTTEQLKAIKSEVEKNTEIFNLTNDRIERFDGKHWKAISKNKKMAIVVRKDLNLTAGKTMAQIAHAVERSDGHADYVKERIVCVILVCKSEVALLNLHTKCLEKGIAHGLQVDAGVNEVSAGTPTCLCVGPDDFDKVTAMTKRYRLMAE